MVDLGPVGPWAPPALPWPPEADWLHVTSLLNPITGEFVPLVAKVHREDLDWLFRSWQDVFAIEWKVRLAEQQRVEIDPFPYRPDAP